jgi:hypothetical protein
LDLKSIDELTEHKDYILSAPKDESSISLLCVRPEEGERVFPESVDFSVARGAIGDNWERGTWLTLDDGSPSPDVQVSILPKRIFDLVCEGAIHPGDTVIADLDLSEKNLPIGQQLKLGEAIVEVGPEPNYGCDTWAHRYGNDALRFVAKKDHQPYRLRGVLCKIVKDGKVSVGDTISLTRS